ncbi:MAG: sugar phosphate isomerase/epimerase [Verrucomicrobia bacterium]|nr:sugar phosphate isomerase/epimerase [Verrucomicrobiota bacterium]MDA1068868.1 sugar phosphate isomerase/epimerase [Verrucomicrobiota bacterium]
MTSKIPFSNKLSRREAITAAGALITGLCAAPFAQAMKPVVRTSKAPLKLSLAAYSRRTSLPDTRKDPNAVGEMDMLGFIDYASTLGIDAVELTGYFMPYPLTTAALNEMKRRAHMHGLGISGGAIGNNFTHDPGSDEGRKQMQYTRTWIDHYSILGAPVIRVFGGKPVGDISEAKAVKNIITNLKIACDFAAEKGVILGIENHDFLVEIDRLMPIIEAIDSPWFGVNFDSGNIAPTDDPYRELARIAPYTVNAQIKTEIPINGNKEPSDLGRIIGILRKANYRGYITLEYEGKEDPVKAIPKHLAELRRLIE